MRCVDCARPHVVSKFGRTVEYRHAAHLERAFGYQQLRRMVASGELLACAEDKTRVATFQYLGNGHVRSIVSGTPMGPEFERENARLLVFDRASLCVVGKLRDGRSGVFRIHDTLQISRASDLIGVQNGSLAPIIYLYALNKRGEKVVEVTLLGHGSTFEVDANARVCELPEGNALVVEPICGTMCRYIVGSHGFKELRPVVLPSDATILGIGRYRGSDVIAIRGKYKSWIEVNGQNPIHLEGELEQLWCSPSGSNIAWLEGSIRSGKTHRRLYYNHEIVYEGDFEMSHHDLAWSNDAHHMAACVTHRSIAYGHRSIIVHKGGYTSVPDGRRVNELCVDDNAVPVWIDDDGAKCYIARPGKRSRFHDGVATLAWNLSVGFDGVVCYNAVYGDVVMSIEQRG